MKILLFSALCGLVVSTILGFITIPLLRKLKAGQTVLHYVKTHKDKNGTPTMGGLFFIVSAVVVFFAFGGANGRLATIAVCIGLAFMTVGFLDDFIKIKFHKNEGLKAYQKIIFQAGIALVAGIYVYLNDITIFYIPFSNKSIDFNVFTVPIVFVVFIAVTNSVNLTDGLDGLAGSVCLMYLLCLTALVLAQIKNYGNVYLYTDEYEKLNLLSTCLIGSIMGFLLFNSSKAKVFMGDTGSLSLGGFIGAISIFTSNSLFIPVIGIMFVLSSISVIVQVAYYIRTKKRVLLMAPLHHHFQMKGYTETQISYAYSLVTAFFGVACILFYV